MTPEQRDVGLIPVPFSDLTSTRRRPVLILSTTSYNQRSEDVLVAAITSKITGKRHAVRITTADLEQGVLKRTSIIRTDKIYTLSKTIIVKRFGKLTAATFSRVLSEIDRVLGR